MHDRPLAVDGRSEAEPFGIQMDASRYYEPGYLTPERLSSVGWQVGLAERTRGRSLLDVGCAHGLLAYLLRKQGARVIGLDHNREFGPDLVGVLPRLPLRDASVDVALCFQVLEHLPLTMLESCFAELARVAREWVVVSVPNCSKKARLRWRLRWALWRTFRFPRRWKPRPRRIGSEHFWEIGHGGVGVDGVAAAAGGCGLELAEEFRNPHHPYHHFFVFRRRG